MAVRYYEGDGIGRRGHATGEDPTAARRTDDESTVPGPTDTASLTVTPRANGPLVVDGPVALVAPDGSMEVVARLYLCRCGGSAVKPRCDGTHKRIGFDAAGVPPPERTPG